MSDSIPLDSGTDVPLGSMNPVFADVKTEDPSSIGNKPDFDDEDDVPIGQLQKQQQKQQENSSKSTVDSDDDVPIGQLLKKNADNGNDKDDGKRKRSETVQPAAKKVKGSTGTPKRATPAKKVKKEEEEEDSSSDSSSSSESSDSDSSDSSSSDEDSSSDSSSSSDSEDDAPLSKRITPKKATPTKKVVKKEVKPKKEVKKEKKTVKKEKEVKEESKKKKKEEDEPQYKWWLEEPLPEGKKWKTLEHNGVLFPPSYQPHGVKMYYDGKPVDLTPDQEEIATFYSQYIETDHVKKPQFNQNFFKEFLKVLNPKKGDKHVIQKFDKCDFRPIHRHLMEQKEQKKTKTKEEKLAEKEERAKIDAKYGQAIVDGHKQKIANFRVEPPGLFLGRGDHPKAGVLKRRIMPEDVTINIGKKAKVPECPIPGHHWGKIVHDDEVAWLAFWKDSIKESFKYVWLAPSSRIKGQSDMKKFETAQKLKKHISKIREKYEKELRSKDLKVKQRATALWVIDHLALRAGNEKDEDEADTVGCCSLRVEHVKLRDPLTIEFDFLGKDSMRYQNSVKVVEEVWKNFKSFMKGKDKKEDIFDQLTTTYLNNHLKQMMEGLTAKVFRTYNASITLERELAKMEVDKSMTVDEKMLFYNRANREVAILCNHQRSVSKNFGDQMGKIDEKINELKGEKKKLKLHMEDLKTGKKRKREESDDENEDGKKKKKLPDDPDKVKKAISKIDERISKWETKKTEKDELKTVSLTTSKINYIDPRISVAWAKRHSVPIERIFSKTLRQKFPWAMDVSSEWKF